MQVVKNFIRFSLILFSFQAISQEITGTYQEIDQSLILADLGVTYNFKANGTFNKTTSKHLGQKTISGGNYNISGDTIIFKYSHQGNNLQSEIKVIDKKDLNDPAVLFSNISVYNSDGKPQPGVNLLVQNKEKKLLTGFMSNNDGKFPQVSFYDSYIQYFTISWIGSREISIPTDSLFGYRTEVEVHLKDSAVTYYNPDNIFKYIITKRTDEDLELKTLNGNSDKPIILRKF